MKSFEKFPDTSFIKFFPSKEIVSLVKQMEIVDVLNAFLSTWKAHNADLLAKASFVNNHVLAIVINNTISLPSGCSLDSLYRKIAEIERVFQVELNNRNYVFLKDISNQEIFVRDAFKIEDYFKADNIYVLNTLSNTLYDFYSKMWVPLLESAYKNLL